MPDALKVVEDGGRAREDVRVEEDWHALERLLLAQQLPDVLLLLLGHGGADPADPQNVHVGHTEEGGHQPAGAALEVPLARLLGLARRDRQTVGHDDHPLPILLSHLVLLVGQGGDAAAAAAESDDGLI